MTIGERLRTARTSHNFTQEKLSEITSVARENIARYEGDKSKPTLEVLVRLAKGLNVTTDYLLGLEAEPSCVVDDTPSRPHATKSIYTTDAMPQELQDMLKKDPDTADVHTLAARGVKELDEDTKRLIFDYVKEAMQEVKEEEGKK